MKPPAPVTSSRACCRLNSTSLRLPAGGRQEPIPDGILSVNPPPETAVASAKNRESTARAVVGSLRAAIGVWSWYLRGRPAPPPHRVKQRIVIGHARRFQLTTLVESGTYLGDMVAAVRKHFERIYSIELGPELAERARDRFAGDPGVTILCGDSGTVLPGLLGTIERPCIFWLDGHYSGGNTALGEVATPILRELDGILDLAPGSHVILIDDARLFTGEDGYPRLEDVSELLRHRRPSAAFAVEDDVIRIFPV